MYLHKEGLIKGVAGSFVLSLLVLVGSRRLVHFDAALIPYLFATLFAVFGSIYRYTVWLSRPPTRTLWKKSISLFFNRNFFRQLRVVVKTFFQNIVFQKFIGRRSPYRWVMHFLLAWGCLMAFAVTFPLVFGWLHFETPFGQEHMYQLYVFGFPTMIFDPYGFIGFMFFNTLNFCSLMIVVGCVMAFTRRFLHSGEMTTQTFSNDLLPLLILFSVAITGLFMTYSSHYLQGQHYRVLSTIHCWTVVVFLIYLPFGKFFHIFQRASQMGAALYIEEREAGEPAKCVSCGQSFISRMQKEDVKRILAEVGFEYENDSGLPGVQDLCPLCRRRMFMVMQDKRLNGRFDINEF